MKKVVLSLAVLFSVAMVACNGNKKAETVDTVDTLAQETVVAADSDTLAAAQATVTAEGGDTNVTVEAVEAAN